VAQAFELESPDGDPICKTADLGDTARLPVTAPGAITVQISPAGDAIAIRTGVIGGMATSIIPIQQLRAAAAAAGYDIPLVVVRDGDDELALSDPGDGTDNLTVSDWAIAGSDLKVRVGTVEQRITTADRLLLLLPVLMWVAAALLAWLLVSRLLIRPLKRLQRSVQSYDPSQGALQLPRKVGPSTEIQDLRDAFGRAFSRAEESEREVSTALEGQKRLVREVHHRVKNNLQVVASLLNIHGRSAATVEARAAYASISRRVGALSIVHRNHFAEMEESRGIALRPLLTELAAELRASAPETARGLMIELDLDSVYTTQDAAVAVAFLVTEIVEFAMLNCPHDPIEVSLRRSSELTGRLTLNSPVLVPEGEHEETPDKIQFERIVGGLAKQLRSNLERKLGRYSVDLPVFPA
jgi:two-component sensor histidine kinase